MDVQLENPKKRPPSKMPKGTPTGRPKGSTKLQPTDDTFRQIEGLARIHCTQKEAAAVLRVDEDTFRAFLGSHEKAREAWEMGPSAGKASLRRLQFKNAESGHAAMQIWLGKQLLEQTDKVDSTLRGDAANPIVNEVRYTVVEPSSSGA